jgi:hypothetical protein
MFATWARRIARASSRELKSPARWPGLLASKYLGNVGAMRAALIVHSVGDPARAIGRQFQPEFDQRFIRRELVESVATRTATLVAREAKHGELAE